MPDPAPSGVVIEVLESAVLVVTGEVQVVEAFGDGAYQAGVGIDQSLAGGEPPAVIHVVWEERAASRPPRLVSGDRVLLGLERHSETSRWRARQLSSELRWAIADEAAAFLRRPGVGEVSVLEHFLALPSEHRNGPDGARHLLALAASAQPPLALAAARRLAATASTALPPSVAALAMQGLARPESTGVPTALVNWIAQRQPAGLVASLDRGLAQTDAAPAWVRARAQLPGTFEARLGSLEADGRPAMRAAVAATTTNGSRWTKLSTDEDAAVREAAAARPVPDGGSLALLEPSLSDPEPRVRIAAARTLAAHGDDAVPLLQRVGMESTSPARETALAALGLISSADASQAISTIARDHDDAGMRALAELALTRKLGDVHPVDP